MPNVRLSKKDKTLKLVNKKDDIKLVQVDENIKLERPEKKVKLVNRRESIKLTQVDEKIKLEHVGKRGPQGIKGDKGEIGHGIPAGGNPNEVLSKASGADYDYEWQANGSEDKNYIQPFTFLDTVTVNHNLGKYPAVTVFDSTGDEVEGSVEYTGVNSTVVKFSNPFTGMIICN